MNGISALLKQYETFVGKAEAFMPQMIEATERRRLKEPLPQMPQFFTPEEALEMGVELDPGWMLKITPGVEGERPAISYISPTQWEITQDRIFISPEGKRYERGELEADLQARLTGTGLRRDIEAELQEFAFREKQKALTEREMAEREALYAELEAIQATQLAEIEEVFGKVFPTVDDALQVLSWAAESEENLGTFLELVRRIGRDEDTEALLEKMFPEITEEEMGALLGPPIISEGEIHTGNVEERKNILVDLFRLPEEEIELLYATDGTREETEAWARKYISPKIAGGWIDKIHQCRTGIYPPMGLSEKAQLSFAAGIGDVFSSAGGAAAWLNLENIAPELAAIGTGLQRRGEAPSTLGEFEWSQLLDPEFYATKVTRTVPFCLSLIPFMIGGFIGGTSIAAALGLGKIATFLIGAFSGAVLSRPAESALEAGEAYNLAMAQGKTETEASEAAKEVFTRNLTLVGMDAFQIAIALAPTPKWIPLKLIEMGLVTTVRVGGKMVIIGLSEGGEEIYQDIIQRQARGEEWHWDAISKEVFAIGLIMGMGMGLGGDVMASVMNKSKADMSPSLRKDFDDAVSSFELAGFTRSQAELKALEEISKTPEGEKVVQEAIEAVKVPEAVPEATLSLEEISKYETRIPLDLIRKDEPETLARLTEEIKREGITEPITIRVREDGSQIVWDGIHRLIVAQDLGIKNIPVKYIGEVAKLELKPPVVEEVKPELFMTQEQWGTMPEQARAKALAEAGLSRKLASKGWAVLTLYQREALRGEPEIIEAPERIAYSEGGVPIEPTAPMSQEVADNIPVIKDIGILERWVRPTRLVFQRMGLYETYKGIQKAEVELGEAKKAFGEKLKEVSKLVDRERRHLVFRELENPGSQVGLTFQEKRAVNFFRENFNKWADILNLPQEKRLKNYITHIFETDIAEQLKEKHPLDPAIARALEYKAPKTIFNPFLQERLGATTGLIEDPFAAASAYESRQLRVLYYEPWLQKIAAIANLKTTPPVMRDYLRDYARRMTGQPSKLDIAINNTLLGFAGAIEKLPGGTPFARFLTRGNPSGMAAYNFTSLIYTLWLGFKPTSAIRNLSQHTLIIGEVGPVHFANGIGLRFTEEGQDAVNNHSLVWRSRKAAFVPGIDDSFTAKWTDKFRESALWMFRKADEQNVKDAFLSGYAEAKSLLPDADPQVWYARGDEVAADTQYLYTQMNSMAISQSSAGRVFSILTTWSENWMELMTKWVSKRPSQVYLQYERETDTVVPKKNWSQTYKAIGMYMAIIALGFLLKEETRLKAWEYTGITSIRYLANVVGGDFPGLQVPGAVANMVAGFIADDERMLKSGWSEFWRTITPGIVRQAQDVALGEKDWLTLFLYLEGKDWPIKQLKNEWEKGWKDYEALETQKERDEYRENNPKIEAQMFIISQFTTLTTEKARQEVLRIIEANKLDTELIDGYEKVFGVDTDERLAGFRKLLGIVELDEKGEQKLLESGELDYYTTSNFASDVNKLVKVVGREKVEKDGNPLAVEYLRAKDLFVQYESLTTDEARTLFRQQFPDVEAQLYLWGRIASFKNPKSAEILLGLMDKYDLSPESIPAFLDNPKRYDEMKQGTLDVLLENFRTIEGEERFDLLGEAVDRYGQLAVKDMLTVDEVAKYNWDIRSFDWKKHGILAHYVHWGNEFYKVVDWLKREADLTQVERIKARVPLFESTVMNKLLPIYMTELDGWPEKTWQILLASGVKRYGADELKKRVEEIGEPNQWERIQTEIDKIAAMDEERIEVYAMGFTGKLADTYLGWYSESRKGYEDDWFLMENPEFYATSVMLLNWAERDFSKVPTRKVYDLYLAYKELPPGQTRLDYRTEHPDLDAWGVLKFDWVPVGERGDGEVLPVPPPAPSVPTEQLEDWQKALEDLKRRLAGL